MSGPALKVRAAKSPHSQYAGGRCRATPAQYRSCSAGSASHHQKPKAPNAATTASAARTAHGSGRQERATTSTATASSPRTGSP